MENHSLIEQEVSGYTIKYDGQLMKNYMPSSLLDAKESIKVARDVNGHPIIFQQQEDDISVTYYNNDKKNWHRLFFAEKADWDKMSIKDRGAEIKAFDILQDEENGKIWIGFVLHWPEYTITETVLYAADNDLSKWESLNVFKDKKSGYLIEELFAPSYAVRLNRDVKNVKIPPYLFLVSIKGKDTASWISFFGYYNEDYKWIHSVNAEDVYLHENSRYELKFFMNQNELDIACINFNPTDKKTTLSIYKHNDKSDRLEFITSSILEDKYLMESLTTRDDYYIYNIFKNNGTTVSQIANQTQNLAGVVPQWVFSNIKDKKFPNGLTISQTVSQIAAWLLDENGNLYYSTATVDEMSRASSMSLEDRNKIWSPELKMGEGVVQMAAFVHSKIDKNNLIYLKEDGSLHYLYQTIYGNWIDEKINAEPHNDKIVEFTSFTTNIVLSKDGQPLPYEEVTLISKDSGYFIINDNLYYFIGGGNKLRIKTDQFGSLNIISQTETVTSSIFYLSPPNTDKYVTIDPSLKVKEELNNINNGNDLYEHLKKRGVIPREHDSEATRNKCDHIAKAINKLTSVALHLDGHTSTSWPKKAESVEDISWSGTSFGVINNEFHSGDRAHKHFDGIELNILHDVSHWCGGVLHHLEHYVSKAGDWVIKKIGDATHFIINLAGKPFNFILHTVEEIGHIIGFVFKKMLDFVKDVVDFIGYLFEWDDILRTKEVAKKMLQFYFEQAEDNLREVKENVDAKIDEFKAEIKKWSGEHSVGTRLGNKDLNSQANQNANSGEGKKHSVANSAPAKFLFNHLVSHASHGLQSGGSSGKDHLSNEMGNILSDLTKLKDTLVKDIKSLVKDLEEYIRKAVDDKHFDWKEGLEKIFADIVDITLDLLKGIFDVLLDFLIDAASLLWKILDTPISGFLVELIKEISGKEIKLSLLDIIIMVGAVPSTLIYKAINDKAPFPEGDAQVGAILNAKNYDDYKKSITSSGNTFAAGNGLGKDTNKALLGCASIISGISTLLESVLKAINEEAEDELPVLDVVIGTLGATKFYGKIIAAVTNTSNFSELKSIPLVSTVLLDVTILEQLAFKVLPSSVEGSELKPVSAAIDATLAMAGLVPNGFSIINSIADGKDIGVLNGMAGILNNFSTLFGTSSLIDGEEITKQILIIVGAALGIEACKLQIVSGALQLAE